MRRNWNTFPKSRFRGLLIVFDRHSLRIQHVMPKFQYPHSAVRYYAGDVYKIALVARE